MAAKILIGLGLLLVLMAGGLYMTQQIATQVAVSSYQSSVQQYAAESSAVGTQIALAIAGFGGVLCGLGAVRWAFVRVARVAAGRS